MTDIDVPICHSTKTALFDEERVACAYLERITRFAQCKCVRPRRHVRIILISDTLIARWFPSNIL